MKVRDLKSMLANRKQRDTLYCTNAYWNAKAEEYEGDAVSMWPNNHLNRFYHQEQSAVLGHYLPDIRGKQVLDIGCGVGRLSRVLAEGGAIVEGVDFAEKAVEIATQLSPSGNPRFRVLSIFELNDTAAFDIAVAWAALTVACQNREQLLDVMRRIRQALKPGGHLLVCEPIHRGFLHRVLNMSLREFHDVMREAGFDVLSTTHLHYWPMRLLLAYLPWPRALTAAGYYLGKGIMALFGNRAFGDYKAIYAVTREV